MQGIASAKSSPLHGASIGDYIAKTIIAAVRRLSQLRGSLLLTAMELAHRASDDGVTQHTRYSLLAAKCHYSLRTAIRHIHRLVALGIIQRQRFWRPGREVGHQPLHLTASAGHAMPLPRCTVEVITIYDMLCLPLEEAPRRVYVQFTDVQDRPLEFLDVTSLTLEEFPQMVPPFEAAFQAHMAAWRLDGTPRTARQFRV